MSDAEHKPAWKAWLNAAPLAPPFQPPLSRDAWQQQRRAVRSRLSSLLGQLPPRPSWVQPRITRREDRGDYFLERLEFDNAAGAIIPGYLLLPKKGAGRKAPAILYCHWHGGEYDHGKEELFRSDHVPEPPGPALARRGYVVLAIDAYCFGERNGAGPGGPRERNADGELTAVKFCLWTGRTLWGMILRDDLIALDYLASRTEVDPERIGATGISMGATRTWWLMALDERLKAGVAVACLTRYQNLIAAEGLRFHGAYYYVPGLLAEFDTESIVSLIAPRPILFQTGDRDSGSPADGVRIIEDCVRPVYALCGEEAKFKSILYAGVGHEYRPEMWQQTLSWFEQHLRPGS